MAGAQGLLPEQAALHNFWLPGRANKFVFLGYQAFDELLLLNGYFLP